MTQWADSSRERLAELWLVNRDLYASDSSLVAGGLFAAPQSGLPALPEELAPAAGKGRAAVSGWAERASAPPFAPGRGAPGTLLLPGDRHPNRRLGCAP